MKTRYPASRQIVDIQLRYMYPLNRNRHYFKGTKMNIIFKYCNLMDSICLQFDQKIQQTLYMRKFAMFFFFGNIVQMDFR